MFAQAGFLSRVGSLCFLVALACVAAAAVDCPAQDPQPLAGQLYMSVFKQTPQADPRQIVVVDLETGRYEDVGAPGLDPRVSPDGKRVAYWTFGGQNESNQAWIKELGRDAPPRFLSYGQISGWLNDGSELILNDGHRPEGGNRWLYTNCRIDASGANKREFELPPEARVVDCTGDGKWLLLSGVGLNQLHLMPADGGEPKRVSLGAHRASRGRLSPDGKQVAYVVSATPDRVMVVDCDRPNWLEIYCGTRLTDPRDLCWSPDGKRAAVVLFDWIEENGRRVRRGGGDHNFRVVFLDKEKKNPTPLMLEGLGVTEINGLDWK